LTEPKPVTPQTTDGDKRALPRGVWMLGLVSLFMDISSELVHSLLPIFMATVLGASMITIGIIEGVAEATAAILKVYSGVISDRLGKRKLLAVIGYGMAALTKPIFPMATSIGWVFTARFIDRIGKGIRGAPRDALIADLTPAHQRGAAYGLRQSLDSIGAFVGPLLAIALLVVFTDITTVLWFAVIPAFIAVAILVFGVHEPKDHAAGDKPRPMLSMMDAKRLSARYWWVVALGGLFGLARFSEAFLILRTQELGMAIAYLPLVLIIMNIVFAAVSFPAGLLADRIGTRGLLLLGMIALVAADVVLAYASDIWHALAGSAVWGLHMGLTQGLLAKLVADQAPADLRGTAFGFFNLVTGVALLLASTIAGGFWSFLGPSMTFLAGAAFATLAAIGLWVMTASRTAPARAP
jgi:MFS family permease